jgi:hypothetical protein
MQKKTFYFVLHFMYFVTMTFREGNKINYSKKDFSFKPKTKITRQGSTTIRIGPRNKCDFAQPFSIGRGDEIVPKEASNLRG